MWRATLLLLTLGLSRGVDAQTPETGAVVIVTHAGESQGVTGLIAEYLADGNWPNETPRVLTPGIHVQLEGTQAGLFVVHESIVICIG